MVVEKAAGYCLGGCAPRRLALLEPAYGQVAEWFKAHALERVYRGNSIEGSNPSLSAIIASDLIVFPGHTTAALMRPPAFTPASPCG